MFSWFLLIKTWWLQWVSIKVDQCFSFEITMLRKRSRTVVPSKQALMAENGSPKDKNLKPTTTSLFSSPRLFSVLSSSSSSSSSKVFSESDCVKSPTSILDNKPFSGFGNPFWSDNKNLTLENRHHPWEKNFDSGVVGLGIVDALNDEEHNQKFTNNPNSTRMVLFGSQLKIQIPPIPSLLLSSFESPKSPNDFGIKTYTARKSPFGSSNSGLETTPNSPKIFTGCLSATEMECSEDYTCVITHGPNPRTTHIFDDCIVENCCGVVGFSASMKEENICSDQSSEEYPSESFLSFCCTCKKNLEQGKDIYMYRGEKAFCSHECRNQEILIDEGKEKSGLDIDST